MPFKRCPDPLDYHERFQSRPRGPDWLRRHQAEFLREALGLDLYVWLGWKVKKMKMKGEMENGGEQQGDDGLG